MINGSWFQLKKLLVHNENELCITYDWISCDKIFAILKMQLSC